MENLPKPALYYGSGVKHHIGSLLYGLTIVKLALRERPDVLIVDSGTTHWIVLALLSLFGIPVIAVIHNTLWPMGFPPKRRLDRILRSIDGFYFRHFAAATVAVSPECERQVRRSQVRHTAPSTSAARSIVTAFWIASAHRRRIRAGRSAHSFSAGWRRTRASS